MSGIESTRAQDTTILRHLPAIKMSPNPSFIALHRACLKNCCWHVVWLICLKQCLGWGRFSGSQTLGFLTKG